METQKQKSTINSLYALLILSTILSFVPFMAAQAFSLILLTVVLIAAYIYRFKDKEDGLLYNHMTYLIGTIWIGTTVIVLGIVAAGLWVYMKGDHAIIHDLMTQAQGGYIPGEDEASSIMINYMTANKSLLVTASLVTIGPAILYFVYRIANGFSRALRGYRIANPKSWM